MLNRKVFALTATLVTSLSLAACGASDDPAAPATSADGDETTIVIGTANFPESEIIGRLWEKVLQDAGYEVKVRSGIGSREVYLTALESGEIDIMPEYTGNLAQFYDGFVEPGADENDVYQTLNDVLPQALAVGNMAPAESKDSFNVTAQFSREKGITSIGDLAKLDGFTLAANPEISGRPFGPEGLKKVYGIDKVEVKPISDAGGPLTVAALASGEIDVANIYTTSPVLDRDGKEVETVRLQDPENLIPAQNVVPVYKKDKVPQEAVAALDKFDEKFTTDDLKSLNERNVGAEKAEAKEIAADFLSK